MQLTFLGRGAAFYPTEGSNSAYFIENHNLFLIDCGESVFRKLIENHLLADIQHIHIFLTHTHSDHVGSLASLLSFCYFAAKIPCHIIMSDDSVYQNQIQTFLSCQGCEDDFYDFRPESTYDQKYQTFTSVRYHKTHHVDNLTCFGLEFQTEQGLVYYSGDTDDLEYIKNLFSDTIDTNTNIPSDTTNTTTNVDTSSGTNSANNNTTPLAHLYVDTNSSDQSNGHLYLGDLAKIIPSSQRNKVTCMHFNNANCITQAKSLGFNIAKA